MIAEGENSRACPESIAMLKQRYQYYTGYKSLS
jgi:hypothetical protein